MEIPIMRRDDTFTSEQLKEELERLPGWSDTVRLDIRSGRGPGLRALDPTVLVAVVSVVGSVVGTLMAGLLQLVAQKGMEKITLELGDGRRIDVQAKNAKKELPSLMKLLESAEPKRIIV